MGNLQMYKKNEMHFNQDFKDSSGTRPDTNRPKVCHSKKTPPI